MRFQTTGDEGSEERWLVEECVVTVTRADLDKAARSGDALRELTDLRDWHESVLLHGDQSGGNADVTL